MITSLKEILELANFCHMTTYTIQFESHDKNLLRTSSTEIMTPKPLFQNIFILRRPGVAFLLISLKL